MWKVCGIKSVSAAGTQFFFASGNGNSWKTDFFTLRPPARKRREILWWTIKDEKAVRGCRESHKKKLNIRVVRDMVDMPEICPRFARDMPEKYEKESRGKMSTIILEWGQYVPIPKFFCAIWGKMSLGILSWGILSFGAKCLLADKNTWIAKQPWTKR